MSTGAPTQPEPNGQLPSELRFVLENLEPAVAKQDPLLGRKFGRYAIERRLGQGGMGVVYLARDTELKRAAALKLLLSMSEATESARRRFQVEAEAAARLLHPNIVQIYDCGEVDQQPYLAMEYVSGGSLAKAIKGVPQPPKQAAALVALLADALQTAHEAGIVHRDLKPHNILLAARSRVPGSKSNDPSSTPAPNTPARQDTDASAEPRALNLDQVTPKVADFGLAKLLDSLNQMTVTGEPLGTPSYMAPEQAQGKHGAESPLTDVYALGAILYELLTGRPPFRGLNPADTIHEVIHNEPVSVQQLAPTTPRDLATICHKCLAKEPAKRYPSAAELAADLRRFVGGELIRARPVGHLERLNSWRRRNPLVANLATAVAGTLVASTLVAVVLMIWALGERDRARTHEAEANYNLYLERVGRADRDWKRYRARAAENLLDLCPIDLRDWEWRYLKRRCHDAERENQPGVQSEFGEIGGFSPDGKFLSVTSKQAGPVRVLESATCNLAWQLPWHTGHGALFSPDGKFLVLHRYDADQLVLWNVATQEPAHTFDRVGALHTLAYSPSGNYIAATKIVPLQAKGVVQVFRAGQEPGVLMELEHPANVAALAFSPDERYLATGCSDGRLRLWDFRSGEMLRSVTGPASTSEQYGPIVSVAFHPAGQYLAYVNGRRDDRLAEPVEIRLWAFKTQSKPRTLKRLAATIHQLLIEPSGRYLVTAGDDGAVRFHEIATGWEERVYRHPGKALSMALSPTRDRLAVTTHEGALFMWNLADLQGERQYGQHEKSVTRLAVSPDGKLAATADGNAILHLWSVKDRQQRWKVDTKQDFVETVGFTPDGKYCFTGGRDQCVRFWNTTDGSLHHALLAHPGTVLKDPRDAEERPVFVHTAVMHPDGRWLITGGDDRLLRVFDIATWTEVREPIRRTNPVGVVAISPDGRWIAAGVHLDGAFLWDTTHAWREHAIHLDSPVASIHALAFSPDSLRLAIAYGEGKLEIYDAQSQELVCTCKGHEANVVAIAYHPDGHRLASASKDTHVKLWHARTGVEILSLEGHEGEVRGLSFADNGNKLISTSWDATVRIWDATPLP